MSDDIRKPRELESRDVDARPTSWAPPDILPELAPIEGYAMKWVRTATLGVDDPRNIQKAFRQGYEPLTVEEQPHLAVLSTAKGSIEVDGLIACKIPVEKVRQRNEYYAKQSQAAEAAVDNNLMRENDPRMPLFQDKKSKISFGSGS